nr:hypothetical protein [Tanacetum cinerariifolium]
MKTLFAGSDGGLKKRKTSKDAEPAKEEPDFKVANSDMPQDQEENLGNDDEEPKGKRDQCKSFYGYARGLESRHDVYSTKRIMAMTQVEVIRKHAYGYGYLKEIEVRRADNDLFTFKEGDFLRLRINDIEDMLILIVQNKLTNLSVKSYQKKINVSKPETTKPGIRKKDAYTPYQDPQGFIFVDTIGRYRLMRSDELYKFSDGTLISPQTSLEDITKNIHMEYLSKRR